MIKFDFSSQVTWILLRSSKVANHDRSNEYLLTKTQICTAKTQVIEFILIKLLEDVWEYISGTCTRSCKPEKKVFAVLDISTLWVPAGVLHISGYPGLISSNCLWKDWSINCCFSKRFSLIFTYFIWLHFHIWWALWTVDITYMTQ